MSEFIAKKQMFLVQMSLNTKQESHGWINGQCA